MIILTVMYPDAEDAYFDMDYYTNKHIALVKKSAATPSRVQRGPGSGGAGPGAAGP